MKRYVKSDSTSKYPLKFNIVFNVIIPEYTDDMIDTKIAAASYKGFDIPEGPLIPADKDA